MLATLALSVSLPVVDVERVQWKGKAVDVASLVERLEDGRGEALVRHLERYGAWIDEHGYEVGVSVDGRVLFVAESKPTVKDRMKLVEKSLDAFDELFPPRAAPDPEEVFIEGGITEADHVPDRNPIVLFEVDTPDAYEGLVARIGEVEPQLKAWALQHGKRTGFYEPRLPIAGWQRLPRGFDISSTWRTKNELVHRLARLALHRSYGPQPTWFDIGMAWRVEDEVMGALFSFPYRSEFIGQVEHEGWKAELKSAFRKRVKNDETLSAAEFTEWAPNTWDDDRAAIGWGVSQLLCEYEADALPEIAEAFRRLHKSGFRVWADDGTWTTHPEFTVPGEEQLRVLREHTRDDLLEVLTDFFATWRKPR